MDAFLKRIVKRKGQEEGGEEGPTYYDKITREKIISFTTRKSKKEMTTLEDENVSFGEILSRYEGKRLNLRQVVEWPITSKPYAIAAEDGKAMSKSKSVLRNYLEGLSPEKPSQNPDPDMDTSIVDMMRVIRLISISDMKPSTFLSWGKMFNTLFSIPLDNIFSTYPSLY